MLAGYELVVPTSVDVVGGSASASISATGVVTFTSCEEFRVNNCFSSEYEQYVCLQRISNNGGATNGRIRLSVGGVDHAGVTSYHATRTDINAASIGAPTQDVTSLFNVAGVSTNTGHTFQIMNWWNPFQVNETALKWESVSPHLNCFARYSWNYHDQSASYDGFIQIHQTTELLTGTLAIYGLKE